MRQGLKMPVRPRGRKLKRAEALSELPLVAALLVAAVVIALIAAGGPVLEMVASFRPWPG